MRWRFGTPDVHEDNEVLVTSFAQNRVYTPRGTLQHTLRVAVIEGEILASGQAAIEARRTTIEERYATQQTSAELLDDDGNVTYKMEFPRVLSLVWLQEEHKAHFATALPYRVVVEYDEFASSGIIEYSETITKIGNGGQRVVWPELDNGISIPQIVSNHTNVTITQAGEVVAFGGWPNHNTPILPLANLQNPQEATGNRLGQGGLRDTYVAFWNYVFVFNTNEVLPNPIARLLPR